MRNRFLGLRFRGRDGHGIDWFSGPFAKLSFSIAILVMGCIVLTFPLWMVLADQIRPNLWVPSWDQYLELALIGVLGFLLILFSFYTFKVRGRMRNMRTLSEVAEILGVSAETLTQKYDLGDLKPACNVNGTYYWDVRELDLPNLLLHTIETPAPRDGMLRATHSNINGEDSMHLLRAPDEHS